MRDLAKGIDTEDKSPHTSKKTSSIPVKKSPGCCAIAGIVIAITIGGFFLTMAALIFFGGSQLKNLIQQTGFQFSADQKSFSFKDPETGQKIMVGHDVNIPKNFPDVPIYPGAKIISVVSSDASSLVMSSTKDSVNDVIVFYQNKLPEKGWVVNTALEGTFQIEKAPHEGSVVIFDFKNNNECKKIKGCPEGTVINITVETK